MYTDQGISATNTKHRDGFNRMIADALDGKIDLIVTKSVSRFARNTVDSLTTVRKLKEKAWRSISKENIHAGLKGRTFHNHYEFFSTRGITIHFRECNVGQRKRMADGKVTMPYGRFLGYRKGEDGLPEIVPEEAEIVRLIYKSFMGRNVLLQNCKNADEEGDSALAAVEVVHTNCGKHSHEQKYKGAALLQKSSLWIS